MVVKEVKFNIDVCDCMLKGVNILVDVVKVMLGLKGCNVVIDKFFGVLCIIKDGVLVVKEIELFDKFENMGVQMVCEVVLCINDEVGDGIIIVIVLV